LGRARYVPDAVSRSVGTRELSVSTAKATTSPFFAEPVPAGHPGVAHRLSHLARCAGRRGAEGLLGCPQGDGFRDPRGCSRRTCGVGRLCGPTTQSTCPGCRHGAGDLTATRSVRPDRLARDSTWLRQCAAGVDQPVDRPRRADHLARPVPKIRGTNSGTAGMGLTDPGHNASSRCTPSVVPTSVGTNASTQPARVGSTPSPTGPRLVHTLRRVTTVPPVERLRGEARKPVRGFRSQD